MSLNWDVLPRVLTIRGNSGLQVPSKPKFSGHEDQYLSTIALGSVHHTAYESNLNLTLKTQLRDCLLYSAFLNKLSVPLPGLL